MADVIVIWEVCTLEILPDFSAVAYFFGRKVQEELNIPIDLIDALWGPSCAEVWTPHWVFAKYPELVAAHELVQPNPWVTIERSALCNTIIVPLRNFKLEVFYGIKGNRTRQMLGPIKK